jgi:hypothetical protein
MTWRAGSLHVADQEQAEGHLATRQTEVVGDLGVDERADRHGSQVEGHRLQQQALRGMTSLELHVALTPLRAVPRLGPLDHAADDHHERRRADRFLIECCCLERDAQIRVAEPYRGRASHRAFRPLTR